MGDKHPLICAKIYSRVAEMAPKVHLKTTWRSSTSERSPPESRCCEDKAPSLRYCPSAAPQNENMSREAQRGNFIPRKHLICWTQIIINWRNVFFLGGLWREDLSDLETENSSNANKGLPVLGPGDTTYKIFLGGIFWLETGTIKDTLIAEKLSSLLTFSLSGLFWVVTRAEPASFQSVFSVLNLSPWLTALTQLNWRCGNVFTTSSLHFHLHFS